MRAQPAERLRGYSCMHLALAVGFLSKSAAAWMVPALTFATLVIWERRWRELLRWELYVGLLLQAALILAWVWVVYAGPDGPSRLKVFFWNNLVGRFTQVDAPGDLQYAAGHRNTPGKYLIELPVYLLPWTLLVAAAARRAWRQRALPNERQQTNRFAMAAFVPALCVLSVAATARNIYLAPALPGAALLLAWWVGELSGAPDPWDARALRGTALLLMFATAVFAAAVLVVGIDSWAAVGPPGLFVAVSALGLAAAAACAGCAWRDAGRLRPLHSALGLLLALSALLVGPASQIYRGVDTWQNLPAIGRAIGRDAAGRPMILFAPDETTRAFIDMFARPSVEWIPGPVTPQAIGRLKEELFADPQALVVTQLPGRNDGRFLGELTGRLGAATRAHAEFLGDAPPAWAADLPLVIAHRYALPNGRRYALLARDSAAASR